MTVNGAFAMVRTNASLTVRPKRSVAVTVTVVVLGAVGVPLNVRVVALKVIPAGNVLTVVVNVSPASLSVKVFAGNA